MRIAGGDAFCEYLGIFPKKRPPPLIPFRGEELISIQDLLGGLLERNCITSRPALRTSISSSTMELFLVMRVISRRFVQLW